MKIKKDKILFLVQIPPPVHGAAIMNELIIKSQLVNNKYDISVVSLDFITEISEIGVFNINKLFVMTKIFFRLFYKLIFYRPKFIFFNLSFKGGAFYRDLIYLSLAKLFNVPVTYYIQGKGVNESASKNRLNRKLLQFAFKNENVICLSKFLTNDLDKVFDGQPFIVNNGIEIHSLENINYSTKRDKPTIIYLSALAIDKGLFILLESLMILIDLGYDFTLKIIGSPLSISLIELSKYIDDHNLKEYVNYIGTKYGDEKYKELLESDIFVFPTLNEAFGLVNLEAMQCGLAVISTYEGAIPEIIDDGVTGLLVEKNNPGELAKKIEFLLKNPDLRTKMGEAGRVKFNKKYTSEIFEQNMVQVFECIINSK